MGPLIMATSMGVTTLGFGLRAFQQKCKAVSSNQTTPVLDLKEDALLAKSLLCMTPLL